MNRCSHSTTDCEWCSATCPGCNNRVTSCTCNK